ncbi:hypothetical protein CEXT_813331 [Caerostris extrusa]|uniref:Secreted protein n=1 Tax=Caerostris extrusa TaxID=172846 RepID=A0AAV4S356_CAEEX|nr:hypothetical protein CEXT_813331 [Caerostris extrusa]
MVSDFNRAVGVFAFFGRFLLPSRSISLPYHGGLVHRRIMGFETSVFSPEVVSCSLGSLEKVQHFLVSTCSQWLKAR